MLIFNGIKFKTNLFLYSTGPWTIFLAETVLGKWFMLRLLRFKPFPLAFTSTRFRSVRPYAENSLRTPPVFHAYLMTDTITNWLTFYTLQDLYKIISSGIHRGQNRIKDLQDPQDFKYFDDYMHNINILLSLPYIKSLKTQPYNFLKISIFIYKTA